MRWVSSLLAALVAAALLGAGPPVGASSHHESALIDREEDCLEPVPASTSIDGATGAGEQLSLDVLVLLDDVNLDRGQEVMKKAAESYAPLNISLDYRFETVAFPPDEMVDGEPTSLADSVIAQAEQWTLGTRPADTDVVYVITNQTISDAAGKADCIGGVRWADGAFAVGENYKSENLAGLFYKNGTAKIAAHEIGHLMGAHHHYTNCAEGIQSAVEEMGPTPCSTMFPYMDLVSMTFSSLEGAVIRGHTIDYATGRADVNPVFSSAVAASRTGNKVKGQVTSSDARCRKRVPVEIQSYEGEKGWLTFATTRTKRDGSFTATAGSNTHQRAFLPEYRPPVGDTHDICAQAATAI